MQKRNVSPRNAELRRELTVIFLPNFIVADAVEGAGEGRRRMSWRRRHICESWWAMYIFLKRLHTHLHERASKSPPNRETSVLMPPLHNK